MTTSMTRRAVASLAALSLAAAPAALASTHSSSLRSQAEKYCRAQEHKLGGRNFKKQYGPKNAFGKCVSMYEKSHSNGTSHGKKSHGTKGKKKGHSK